MNNDIITECTRTLIKQGVGQTIDNLFGRERGEIGKWFRQVRVGAWLPGNKMRPACTVVDNGAKRVSNANSATTKARVLAVHVILDLADEFEKESKQADWSDRVERMALELQNNKVAGGLRRFDYVGDEPFTVALTGGSSEQIWFMEFEAEYWVEVPAMDF